MGVQLTRAGKGLALCLPEGIAEQAHLKEGDQVDVAVENGRIVVTPARRPRPSLEDLVEGITPDNRHEETDWGPPTGREVW